MSRWREVVVLLLVAVACATYGHMLGRDAARDDAADELNQFLGSQSGTWRVRWSPDEGFSNCFYPSDTWTLTTVEEHP